MSECNKIYLTDETLNSLSLLPSPKLGVESVITDSDENALTSINGTFSQIETIGKLRLRLKKLYDCIANDQIIHIHNFENIKLPSVAHSIKHKIDSLFFEAGVPQTWKIDIKWTITPVLVVHVRMLNHLVKEKTKEILTAYFSTNYHNNYMY
jgi:hypothetical protein